MNYKNERLASNIVVFVIFQQQVAFAILTTQKKNLVYI